MLPRNSKIGVLYINKMSLMVDQITVKFPHKVFLIIEVEPDYHITHNMLTLLYVKVSTLSTTLGGGNHGHIGVVIWDTLYATILPTTYNAPLYPGITTQVPAQATTAVYLKIKCKHAEACCIK